MHLSMAGLAAADVDLHGVWGTIKEHAPSTWAELKSVLELGGLFFGLFVATGALWRLPRIVDLVKAINEGRAPIWDLRTFSNNLPGMLKQMQAANAEMQAALDQIKDSDFKQRLDNVLALLKENQRESADDSVVVEEGDLSSERNWNEIRNIWNDARDKLETIVDGINDGRTARKYEKLSRRDYAKLIDQLFVDALINHAIVDDAGFMNSKYRSFMNRRIKITDNDKRDFVQHKERFDDALLHLTSVSPSQSPITFEMPPPPSPISVPSPRTNGRQPPAG
jgi:hypothetical protein